MRITRKVMVGLTALIPLSAAAQEVASQAQRPVSIGVSGIWVLANFSYAGMRAQNSSSSGWRILAFIFGFPGTLISFLAIQEGGERAYGVDVPRRHR